MKIIFLDIDGVLNHQTYYNKRLESGNNEQYPFSEFCKETVERVNVLIDKTSAKVVISSTWRLGRTISELQEILNKVGFRGEIIDITPSFHSSKFSVPRGCEIEYWLKQQGFQRINWSKKQQLEYLAKSEVKNYVILDDDSDMLYNQREHFVKCNAYKLGFDDLCLEKAIKVLNTNLEDIYYQDI